MSAPRDAGMRIGDSRRSRRGRDPWLVPLLAVIGVVLLAGVVFSSASRPAARERTAANGAPEVRPLAEAVEITPPAPTPVFAAVGGLRLRLPVPASAVTAVAFHQASFNHAVALTSLVPQVSVASARRAAMAKRAANASHATTDTTTAVVAGTTATSVATGPAADVWKGSCIRLWRSGRSGQPDTAVDVGAAAGTEVVSPVDGQVVYVRAYKLYNRFPDFEVHIRPSASPTLDVVMIHVDKLVVKAGDEVQAGITRIASVRRLSNLTSLQLRDYTTNGGDHTHIQVNSTPRVDSLWVTSGSGPVVVSLSSGSIAATEPQGGVEP